jgi:hypothetical protein
VKKRISTAMTRTRSTDQRSSFGSQVLIDAFPDSATRQARCTVRRGFDRQPKCDRETTPGRTAVVPVAQEHVTS